MSSGRAVRFQYRMAKSLILAQYKANQVIFPEVQSMTVNIMTGRADGLAGVRHFNKSLLPGIRIANPQIEFQTKSRVYDKEIIKPSIDITFKDGRTVNYFPWKKDQIEIYNELATLGRGKYWLKTQNRALSKPQLGEAQLVLPE